MGVNPNGRNWGLRVNWDDLGKFYASFAIVWTVMLVSGMGWLMWHRNLSFLKIRNIPLAIAATSTLHVYLVEILLAYTENGHFPCTAEFWIMSIYLPFGIALFQANMVQLQTVSGQQKKLLKSPIYSHSSQTSLSQRGQGPRRLWARWRSMTVVQRTYVLIAIGMLTQFFVTLAIYLASRRFHKSWGSISQFETPLVCRKGWEWIPSTIWQLVWAWFYGPFILYKIRNIKDVHHWRLQTAICVVSGLPGTPLWLASTYAKSWTHVNEFWVPAMWLAPGIIVMQAVTIFFPIFEAFQSRAKMRATLSIIRQWEEQKRHGDSTSGSGSVLDNSSNPKKPGSTFTSTTTSSRSREMYTMVALDKALSNSPIPLLQFAATKDFSGENIVFLMQVRDWRAAWGRVRRYPHSVYPHTVNGQVRRQMFNIAVEIYALSINDKTANFPVNIESRIRSGLDAVFAPAALQMEYRSNYNVVDPFNHPAFDGDTELGEAKNFRDFSMSVHRDSESDPRISESKGSQEKILSPVKSIVLDIQSCVPESISIPSAFDEYVFDAAEKSVKYLVVTNTWPKFVDSHKEPIEGF